MRSASFSTEPDGTRSEQDYFGEVSLLAMQKVS